MAPLEIHYADEVSCRCCGPPGPCSRNMDVRYYSGRQGYNSNNPLLSCLAFDRLDKSDNFSYYKQVIQYVSVMTNFCGLFEFDFERSVKNESGNFALMIDIIDPSKLDNLFDTSPAEVGSVVSASGSASLSETSRRSDYTLQCEATPFVYYDYAGSANIIGSPIPGRYRIQYSESETTGDFFDPDAPLVTVNSSGVVEVKVVDQPTNLNLFTLQYSIISQTGKPFNLTRAEGLVSYLRGNTEPFPEQTFNVTESSDGVTITRSVNVNESDPIPTPPYLSPPFTSSIRNASANTSDVYNRLTPNLVQFGYLGDVASLAENVPVLANINTVEPGGDIQFDSVATVCNQINADQTRSFSDVIDVAIQPQSCISISDVNHFCEPNNNFSVERVGYVSP